VKKENKQKPNKEQKTQTTTLQSLHVVIVEELDPRTWDSLVCSQILPQISCSIL